MRMNLVLISGIRAPYYIYVNGRVAGGVVDASLRWMPGALPSACPYYDLKEECLTCSVIIQIT